MYRMGMWLGCAFGVWGSLAVAAEGTFPQAVTALLEQGWKPTPNSKALDEFASLYAAARQAAPEDIRGPYAYALVLTRQRKYDDALKLLDEVLAKDKSNLSARRMKIWLLMLTKRYTVALVEMDALGKSFPPTDVGGEGEAPYQQASQFLGRMTAYLEGPVGNAINQNLLLEHKTKLWTRLTVTRQDGFESGFKSLTERYTVMTRGKDQTQADAKAEEEKLKEQTKRELEAERVRVAQELSGLDGKADKVRKDGNKEVGDLDAQLQPLNSELARVASRRNAIASEVIQLQNDIASYLDAANRTRDQNEAFAYRAEAARLEILFNRSNSDLRTVELQLADVNTRRNQVEGRRQAAAARLQQALDTLERQALTLRQTEKRIGFDEQKLRKPVTGNTAKVTSQAALLNALTTYDEYPLEGEKQRILESLR